MRPECDRANPGEGGFLRGLSFFFFWDLFHFFWWREEGGGEEEMFRDICPPLRRELYRTSTVVWRLEPPEG